MLLAVEHLYEYVLVVRAPCHAGEISLVCEFRGDNGRNHVPKSVADKEGNPLGRHSVHGVAYLLETSRAGGDVQKRKLRDFTFVLAVYRQIFSGRGGEYSSADAEFVAGYAFSDHNPFTIFPG